MKKIFNIVAIIFFFLVITHEACPMLISSAGEDPEFHFMKAEIITIGDEILIGQIIDTNSSWLAERLNIHGIEVRQITSVHDEEDHIIEALKKSEEKADLIILTGGLGPTVDDITKEVLCNYFDTELIFHEPTLRDIKRFIERRGISMNRFNRDQALVPASCKVLPNKFGTAPGLWFEKNGKIFISLPGVPFEMKHIMENEVFPGLRDRGKIKVIYHKTVLTQGLPESALSEKLEKWESDLPKNIKLAYLPDPVAVKVRLSALGDDMEVLKKQVSDEIDKLKQLIPGHIFGYDHDTMAGVIGRMLTAEGKTLAVAEIATGGYISHLVTSDPASRDYFRGCLTAYSDDINKNILGIDHGMPGNKAAREMAIKIRELAGGADYAVATSGIISQGEMQERAVWIAVAGPDGIITEKFLYGDNNERNVIRLSQTALQILRRMILAD